MTKEDWRFINEPKAVDSYALDFDGVDDHVEVPDDSSLKIGTDDLTVSFWIRVRREDNFDEWGYRPFTKHDDGLSNAGYGFQSSNNGNKFRALISDGSNSVTLKTEDVLDSEWHHIIMTVDKDDSNGFKLYQDNELVGTEDPTNVGDISNTEDIYFARGNEFLDCIMDDVRIYNRALTESEVQDIYENKYKESGDEMAHWKMNEGEGGTVEDSSGNDNDGTINGATWTDVGEYIGAAIDEDFYDARIVDAVNRFARKAKVDLLDYDGVKHQEYTKGTPCRIEIDDGDGYFTKFGGFVLDVEREDDVSSLTLLAHDLWLRRRDVLRSYGDQAISDILEDLITTLTPLVWDASLVDVQNDRTITRRWKGEKLSECVDELASISGNENYGATVDGRFFFRPRQTGTAPFDLTESRFVATEFDEEGKKDVNQVTVYFGEDDATGAVTVADREQQQTLADRLDRPRPVVIETSKAYPEITFDPDDAASKEEAEEAARRKGRKIIQGRTGLLKGKVTSWRGFRADAGDVIFVQDVDKDISTEFRIAEIEYNYLSGKTVFKLAENTEGVIDVLVDMSEEVTRVDLRSADEEVVPAEYVEIATVPEVETTVKAFKITVPDDQFLWGERRGGWGHPDVGGGRWGDQRGDPEEIETDVVL